MQDTGRFNSSNSECSAEILILRPSSAKKFAYLELSYLPASVWSAPCEEQYRIHHHTRRFSGSLQLLKAQHTGGLV